MEQGVFSCLVLQRGGSEKGQS